MYEHFSPYNIHLNVYYPVPGTPTDIMISPPLGSCDELVITWTAPAITEGDLLVKYKVHINNETLTVYNKTNARVIELTANTEYSVTVVAFNELGDGGNVRGTRRTRPEGLSNVFC